MLEPRGRHQHFPRPPMNERPLLLGVNIDHAATLRQARYRNAVSTCGGMVEPDPVWLALEAESAGADGITVHLREDRRHIQPRDVARLAEAVRTRLNLEMAATADMLAVALETRPAHACLVPENRAEVTTEGGLDTAVQEERLKPLVERLSRAGVAVSLFIDPDEAQVAAAARTGAPCIELHTGSFAHAFSRGAEEAAPELERLTRAAEQAHALGLTVNAGHGINYVNIAEVRRLPHLNELNIGHSILSRALFTGIREAVAEMKRKMAERR